MKTHVVKIVHNIPSELNTIGTNAHGSNQSITITFSLMQIFLFSFGAYPGEQALHVSLYTYESSLQATHAQQH